jgi:hypothetical protein
MTTSTSARLGRRLPCILSAGALALAGFAPPATAQAPLAPSRIQAFTVAGDIAAGWAVALDASAVDIDGCGLRRETVRQCLIHVFEFSDVKAFDCHWWLRVRVVSGERLAWRTIRHTSEDDGCPGPLVSGPASTGQESVPAAGLVEAPGAPTG